MSEKALELLTKSHFDEGLVGEIPEDIKVAHKFGERTFLSSSGIPSEKELHDCGIVYASENPYLLCVMTRGHDFGKSEDLIQSVSKSVYQNIAR